MLNNVIKTLKKELIKASEQKKEVELRLKAIENCKRKTQEKYITLSKETLELKKALRKLKDNDN